MAALRSNQFRLTVAILCVFSIFHAEQLLSELFRFTDMNDTNLAARPDAVDTSYTAALATMACFTTPGCFPSAKCQTGVPQKLQRKKKWEEQSFCVDDLKSSNDCLVYSFGIHVSTEWEEKVAREFGCEVHAFDPTMNHKKDLAPGVTFHKLGLQALGTDMSTTHAFEYDANDPKLLLSLPEITRRLGHENRTIDVLMQDCEGCEWGSLKALACSNQSSRVKQLVTEFHFQKNLGLETEADVMNAAAGIQCLWEERWHVVSIEQSGSGRDNWDYAKGIPSVLHHEGMLLYTTLQRIPPNKPMPSKLLEKYATAQKNREGLEKKLQKVHGIDESMWPSAAQQKLKRLHQIQRATGIKYQKAARKRVTFDSFERYHELNNTG